MSWAGIEMTEKVERKYLKPGRNVQAEAIVAHMRMRGFIEERRPNEFFLTEKGKQLRDETISAFKQGLFR